VQCIIEKKHEDHNKKEIEHFYCEWEERKVRIRYKQVLERIEEHTNDEQAQIIFDFLREMKETASLGKNEQERDSISTLTLKLEKAVNTELQLFSTAKEKLVSAAKARPLLSISNMDEVWNLESDFRKLPHPPI
jgi:hypothetical protein